jgi:hypothetical protein
MSEQEGGDAPPGTIAGKVEERLRPWLDGYWGALDWPDFTDVVAVVAVAGGMLPIPLRLPPAAIACLAAQENVLQVLLPDTLTRLAARFGPKVEGSPGPGPGPKPG